MNLLVTWWQLLLATMIVSAQTSETTESSSAVMDDVLTQVLLPDTPPSFQSTSGYDVGGEDAICLISWIDDDSLNVTIESEAQTPWYKAPELSSPYRNNSPAHLLQKCPSKTSLQLRGLSFDSQWGQGTTLFTGQQYTFQINFTTDILSDDGVTQPADTPGVYVRLVLCNALARGFCSPLIDFRQDQEEETTVIVSEPSDGGSDKAAAPVLVGVENIEKRIIATKAVWLDFVENQVSLNVQFAIPANATTGTYLMISHAVMAFQSATDLVTRRLDVGASLPSFTVELDSPPIIQGVSRTTKIGLGCVSFIVGAAALLSIGFMIHHRKHLVMKLAQSTFLVGLSFCILIGSIFIFTYMPTQDVYCAMRGFLVSVPFTAAMAIILARCWRVHVTLSNAHMLARTNLMKDRFSIGGGIIIFLTWLARLPFRLFRCREKTVRATKGGVLRQKVTAKETTSLIIMLSLPAICLQIVALTMYEHHLELSFDDNTNKGRYFCTGESRWIANTSYAWMAAILISAVAVAWVGRDLPTAFNEKNAIFNTASVSAVILLVTLMLSGLTDQADSSPDILLFIRCLNFFGPACTMLVNIVMPKIRRVMSGEKVVLTHLLTKYNQQSGVGDSDISRRPTILQSNPGPPVVYTSGNVITLRRHDPLPASLEKDIFKVQGLLGNVSQLCGEGRTPSEAEWIEIRRSVAKLKMELDRVHLDFRDEESIVNNNQPRNQGNGIASRGIGLVSITERQGENDVDGDDESDCSIADKEAVESS